MWSFAKEDRNSYLTDEQESTWLDGIFLPAIYEEYQDMAAVTQLLT